MRIRLPHDIHAKLQRASEYFSIDQSDIIRRALRKSRRIGVVRCKNHNLTTRNGSDAYLFNVPEELYAGMTNAEIRAVIEWYLDFPQHDTGKPKPQLHIEEKGVYRVVNCE